MPFASEEVVERFAAGWQADRLGHAYLLTGRTPETVLALAEELAEVVLGEASAGHPDYFVVQPESKSRRITVEQIRDLEKSLYLRPYRAKRKVAVIQAAERMCLPPAQAANAFLKTLEEPPASTLLLLCSTEPQLMLPTILSRCIRLDLWHQGEIAQSDELAAWLKQWGAVSGPGELRVYARAGLLQEFWQAEKSRIEERFKDYEGEEDTVKALVEGEFQLARQRTLSALQKFYWQPANSGHNEELNQQASRAIQALEELKKSLEMNVEAGLAIEHACLKIEQTN